MFALGLEGGHWVSGLLVSKISHRQTSQLNGGDKIVFVDSVTD